MGPVGVVSSFLRKMMMRFIGWKGRSHIFCISFIERIDELCCHLIEGTVIPPLVDRTGGNSIVVQREVLCCVFLLLRTVDMSLILFRFRTANFGLLFEPCMIWVLLTFFLVPEFKRFVECLFQHLWTATGAVGCLRC